MEGAVKRAEVLLHMLEQSLVAKTETAQERNLTKQNRTASEGNSADRNAAMWMKEEYPEKCDWETLIEMAGKHGVLPLVYEELQKSTAQTVLKQKAEHAAQQTVRQNYRLLILTGQIMNAMQVDNVPVVLLKGMGTASFYPVPELRKSGDVDLLLLDSNKLGAACSCLEKLGCRREEWQPALHHIVYSIASGHGGSGDAQRGGGQTAQNQREQGRPARRIEIELHTMLAEPFDDGRINELLKRQVPLCAENLACAQVAGVEFAVLNTAYHAYELLLHMLQHFLRSGFGLKLLCDWVVFWNRETDPAQQQLYLKLVRECGIKKFSDLVSLTCVKYLGLKKERIMFMEPDETLKAADFLEEILEAEEFGKSSKNRMVALRGNGLWDYVREFHHQMHLNYPGAGKCVLLWPALWCLTLIRFLVNNRKIRKTSLTAILKKAGQRGKIMKNLNLFEMDDVR